jgi:hypothetical protein
MTEETYELENDYLTMARIMHNEFRKYEKKSIWGHNLTGMDNIKAKDAFQAGFVAGFEGKYFNTGGV